MSPSVVKPFRVLVVTHTGEVGGAESALIRLVHAIDPTRYRVNVLLLEQGPLEQRLRTERIPAKVLDGGRLVRVTRGAAARSIHGMIRNVMDSLVLAGRLRGEIASLHPHLVVANSLKAAVLVGIAAPMVRIRWVWHLHDRLATDYLSAPLIALLRVLAVTGPRLVVANSRATATTVAGRWQRNVVVAHPGLDPSAFVRRVPRSRRGPIGILGRVSATKGQREFLDAAERVSVTHPRLRFRIVGGALFDDASVEQELRSASATSVIADQITWTGWLDDPTPELRGLRLLVHASPVPEPFGQVVAEAMAAGVPVIATDAGGVPEILDPRGTAVPLADGVSRSPFGLLVRAGDVDALATAITWAVDHPVDSAEAARSAHAFASRDFRIASTATVVEAAWEAAISGRRRG